MMQRPHWEIEPVKDGAKTARVFSPTNIALAKYWGKRDVELNLPTNGSISATLKDYGSFTTVTFDAAYSADRLILNGVEQHGGKVQKVMAVLNDVRSLAGGLKTSALVQSYNNFPTAAGLASSASGLSAVTYGAARALGVEQNLKVLSEIARKGSGSACRSLFGGFVEWQRGEQDNGRDSVASPLVAEDHWPMVAYLVLVNSQQKSQASTGGMELTRKTSPYFNAWVESAQSSLTPIRRAIVEKDFNSLAHEAELNCLRFHTSAMAANPPIIYWQGKTLDVVHLVKGLRASGLKAFFTIDAGPNVVVFSDPKDAPTVYEQLQKIEGIEILKTSIGPGARDYQAVDWK